MSGLVLIRTNMPQVWVLVVNAMPEKSPTAFIEV